MSRVTLLVADVFMLGSSGSNGFEQLARQRSSLRVLYGSGSSDDTIVRKGPMDPALAFLPRPFLADALTRRVRKALAR